MPLPRFKHPLFRIIISFASGMMYLLSLPFVRRMLGRMIDMRFRKASGKKMVDATAQVIDEK